MGTVLGKSLTLNRKDQLSVAEWLGLGVTGLICAIYKNDTTQKDKTTCNIIGPLLWPP
jgi:hypothetical protein